MAFRLEKSPYFRYIKGMEKAFFEYINKMKMVSEGDVVVAGISGGADSVCLLLLLKKLTETLPFTLIAAHVNHGLRQTALRDEEYVEMLCSNWDIPLVKRSIKVMDLAKETGTTVEEAGRNARYSFFEEILQSELSKEGKAPGAGKIAVAHHQNDCCETMIFNLSRGSSLLGLTGIRPIQGQIIRPLLWAFREQIEQWLSSKGIEWMTDETNLDVNYSRNKIRHEILPVLSKLSPKALEHMTDTARELSEIEDYLALETKACLDRYVERNGDKILIRSEVLSEHPYMVSRVLYASLVEIAGRKKDISRVQVKELLSLFELQVGRKRNFIYGILAERSYFGVELSINTASESEDLPEEICIDLSQFSEGELEKGVSVEIPGGNYLMFTLFSNSADKIIPDKTYTKWFDYDKISSCLKVRTLQKDDYLTITRERNKKSLKDYYKNEKVPLEQRNKLLVLAEEAHILWVIGMRMSTFYQIEKTTQKILQVRIGGHDE